MIIDLKLRNALLALITSRGRKLHYQQLTQSGATLLKHLIEDTKPSAGAYTQSPYTLQLKAAHVRADLQASGAPKSFWPYAVAHAIDILNLMVRLHVAGREQARQRTSTVCVVCGCKQKYNLGKLRYDLIYQEVKTNTLAPLIGEG